MSGLAESHAGEKTLTLYLVPLLSSSLSTPVTSSSSSDSGSSNAEAGRALCYPRISFDQGRFS